MKRIFHIHSMTTFQDIFNSDASSNIFSFLSCVWGDRMQKILFSRMNNPLLANRALLWPAFDKGFEMYCKKTLCERSYRMAKSHTYYSGLDLSYGGHERSWRKNIGLITFLSNIDCTWNSLKRVEHVRIGKLAYSRDVGEVLETIIGKLGDGITTTLCHVEENPKSGLYHIVSDKILDTLQRKTICLEMIDVPSTYSVLYIMSVFKNLRDLRVIMLDDISSTQSRFTLPYLEDELWWIQNVST